jgi:hypothetical protein
MRLSRETKKNKPLKSIKEARPTGNGHQASPDLAAMMSLEGESAIPGWRPRVSDPNLVAQMISERQTANMDLRLTSMIALIPALK